jgi:hypothetical protein
MPVVKTKKARLQAEGEPLIVCRPFFDNPAILKKQDPWLCVPGLLRVCPFGIDVGSYYTPDF